MCIVTNYSTTTNYGAILQAYALNRVISDMGMSPENLYVVGDRADKKRKLKKQIKGLEAARLISEVKSSISRYRVRQQLEARKRAFEEFRFSIPHTERYLKSSLDSLQDRYDIFISGSDQVFRPNRYTGEPERHYFLSMVDQGRAVKASYAASMGIAAYDTGTALEVKELLSTFDYISVREKGARDYLRYLTGREDIVCSLDPVFLMERERWEEISRPYPVSGPYILVYMIHGTEKLLGSIKEFSRLKGLRVVTFPSMSYVYKRYEKDFGDICVTDADPGQFINLIKNAEYVFTDSFHGTAFSLIFNKRAFVSKANEIAFSRIENILELWGTEDMVIPPEGLKSKDYDKDYGTDRDPAGMRIMPHRRASMEYLEKVLTGG